MKFHLISKYPCIKCTPEMSEEDLTNEIVRNSITNLDILYLPLEESLSLVENALEDAIQSCPLKREDYIMLIDDDLKSERTSKEIEEQVRRCLSLSNDSTEKDEILDKLIQISPQIQRLNKLYTKISEELEEEIQQKIKAFNGKPFEIHFRSLVVNVFPIEYFMHLPYASVIAQRKFQLQAMKVDSILQKMLRNVLYSIKSILTRLVDKITEILVYRNLDF